jgi:hypothetical protein
MTDKREKMTKSATATIPELVAQCATDACKQTHHPHRFPAGSGPFCEECRTTSMWAADAANRKALGIYPSRTQGNKRVEEIEEIQKCSRKKGDHDRALDLIRIGDEAGCDENQIVRAIKQDFNLDDGSELLLFED